MAGASGLYARLACMRELRSRSLDPRVCAASRVGIWHVKAGLSKMVEDMPAALHTGAVWSRLIAHDRVWCRFLPKCVSFLTNPLQVHSQPDCTFKCIFDHFNMYYVYDAFQTSRIRAPSLQAAICIRRERIHTAFKKMHLNACACIQNRAHSILSAFACIPQLLHSG